MIDRTRRDLSANDIARIANTYHAWRNRSHSHSETPSPLSSSPSPLEGVQTGDMVYTRSGTWFTHHAVQRRTEMCHLRSDA